MEEFGLEISGYPTYTRNRRRFRSSEFVGRSRRFASGGGAGRQRGQASVACEEGRAGRTERSPKSRSQAGSLMVTALIPAKWWEFRSGAWKRVHGRMALSAGKARG